MDPSRVCNARIKLLMFQFGLSFAELSFIFGILKKMFFLYCLSLTVSVVTQGAEGAEQVFYSDETFSGST